MAKKKQKTGTPPPPRALMVQGTGSDVGKSLLVAGLCRAYTRRGLRVRPFKPQNMSNNAAVTVDGPGNSHGNDHGNDHGKSRGEIGRAQALQAQACGVAPSIHMNPVLLKPQSDTGAQVVVLGRVEATASARDYHALKKSLLPRVLESFAVMRGQADLVLVEGAGSPAEVNLRAADIANMGFAEAADIPVILVGDIDRGGVIASIIGTHALLSDSEQVRLRGYVINKFRGDVTLFADATAIIAERTGLACFGIVPYFAEARLLPQEDAMALDNLLPDDQGADQKTTADQPIRIAVPRLSRIANFDDLDPLMAEADVAVQMIEAGTPLPGDADVVVLPGSKATLADLGFLCAQGWDVDIAAHVRRGGLVVGLCGGYQMLGRRVRDADGVEGIPGEVPGLGLLDVETAITGDKTLEEVSGVEPVSGQKVSGFEMHMGLTEGPDRSRPWLTLDDGRREGACSADGLIMGTYLHGIFAADGFRHAFLRRIRTRRQQGVSHGALIEQTLDRLAEHLEANLDLDALLAIAG